MQVNAMTEEFEHIEIFGKPVLFTNARVDKATVPEGWYRYNIRGSDYDPGSFGTLEREVGVNHAGTILSPEDICSAPVQTKSPSSCGAAILTGISLMIWPTAVISSICR